MAAAATPARRKMLIRYAELMVEEARGVIENVRGVVRPGLPSRPAEHRKRVRSGHYGPEQPSDSGLFPEATHLNPYRV